MAIADRTENKAFCNDLFTELESMRLRIETIREEIEMIDSEEVGPLRSYERHLAELSAAIGWKIQILAHSCPYDWRGSIENVEATVSVPDPGATTTIDFSGGYIGG